MTDQTRLAFHFAPNIKHESIAKMSQAQKDEALHEFIDLRNITREKIFSPSASPQTRIFALCTIYDRAQKTATKRPDGSRVLDAVTQQVPTWIGDKDQEGSLSYRYGMSRNSISNELDAYEKAGLVKRFYPPSADGKSHLAVSVAPELLTNSELLPTKGERPRRKLVTCKDCGSPDIRRKTTTTVTCSDCGCIQSHSEHTCMVNEEDDGTEEAVIPSTPPAVENETSPTEEQTEQDQQPLCTRDVQYVIDMNNCTRDVHNASPEEIARQAADLLLEIAGDHTEHIQMSTKPDSSKYFAVHRPLTEQDMIDHLQGITTKGLKCRSIDGNTRAICKDADTAEDWQRLKDAARLLAIMDFKPLLIPSPIQDGKHAGGGHLWIIFDGPVDAYSALQTIYQYTGPSLIDINEYWPGGGINIRMPGGKYVKHQFEAWCDIYDAAENELSHNGIGAAAALLANQTSIEVVNAYTKPEPAPEPERTTHAPRAGGVLGKDLAKQAIADFNASHSWESLLGKPNRQGKYRASWRGDHTPNVAVDPRTDLAKDFSINAWIPRSMDKYQVHCFIEGKANWQEFKRRDLDERCAQLRETQEPDGQDPEQEQEEIPATLFASVVQNPHFDEHGCPTRMTFCCNVPFQLGVQGPECSNPQCPGKQERQIS